MRLSKSYPYDQLSNAFARAGSLALLTFTFGGMVVSCTSAQTSPEIRSGDVQGYRFVERTIYVKEPVTMEKWVEETEYQTQKVTEQQHITQVEMKERRRVVRKPVTRTTMKEERTITRKPITKTRYREREIEETSYDVVTEIREESYPVERAIVETQYRDENFTVRQKVTEDLIEVTNQTVYRPQSVSQSVLLPQLVPVVSNTAARPRLDWLQPGYYNDPATGQSVYRRRGLHWVQSPTVTTQTALLPATVESQTMVPEVIQTRRPVEVSRFEDRTETRRVPYEVQRMVTETSTRQVPVTVKKPIVKRYVEKIPYTETRYVDVEEVRQVPVVETVYEDVIEVEPYEEKISRWVPVTKEIQVPRTVRRRVSYEEEREVAKTIWVKVPVDRNGNALSMGEPISEDDMRRSLPFSTSVGTTDRSSPRFQGNFSPMTTQETSSTVSNRDQDQRPASVLVPETPDPTDANPDRPLQRLRQPTDDDSSVVADNTPTLGGSGGWQRLNDIEKTSVFRQPNLEGPPKPATPPETKPGNRPDVLETER